MLTSHFPVIIGITEIKSERMDSMEYITSLYRQQINGSFKTSGKCAVQKRTNIWCSKKGQRWMIPEDATFEKYLNHYDVIYLDITL